MPDEVKLDADGNPITADPVADLAAGFKEMVSEVKDFVAESRTVAPAPVAAPDKTEAIAKRKADAQVAYEAKRKEANELMASGEGATAMETFMEGVMGINAANAGDPEDSPQFKAGVASAKKLSRAENKEMFEKYGSEIEAQVATMSAGDRINPESWDRAVTLVKADNLDAIMEQRTKQNAEDLAKADAAARAGAVAPAVAQRGRGTTLVDPDALSAEDLSPEQVEAAEACGLTPEKYVQAAKDYQEHILPGGRVLFMNEPKKGHKVKPGAF